MEDSLQKPDPSPPRELVCERCGSMFTCDLSGRCWCMGEPARLPMPSGHSDCICPECLRAEAARSR